MSNTQLLEQLRGHFPSHKFAAEHLHQLHKGRFANAIVYRYQHDNLDIVIKDFHHSPWFVRKSVAKMFVNQEVKALTRLQGIPGISRHCYRLSELGMAYPYVAGTPLRTLAKEGKVLSESFFRQMEKMVAAMHRRGIVHLDLRNLGNVLCTEQGTPHFIDFQSAIGYRRFPRWLQRFMRGSDLSGAYKAWKKLGNTPLPAEKAQFFERYNQVRKRWIFRGYPIHRAQVRLHAFATQILSFEFVRNIFEKFL